MMRINEAYTCAYRWHRVCFEFHISLWTDSASVYIYIYMQWQMIKWTTGCKKKRVRMIERERMLCHTKSSVLAYRISIEHDEAQQARFLPQFDFLPCNTVTVWVWAYISKKKERQRRQRLRHSLRGNNKNDNSNCKKCAPHGVGDIHMIIHHCVRFCHSSECLVLFVMAHGCEVKKKRVKHIHMQQKRDK